MGDLDAWMRPATKSDGEEYYEYVLVYVYCIIAVSQQAKEVMEKIQSTFKLKNNDIKKAETYLGAKLQEKTMNGKHILYND